MMLFNLISYTLIMSITPGPNNVICLALGSKYGYKTAVRYIIGVVIGCFIMQWLILLLNSWLSDILPSLTTYIGYAGAVYMLYLAYKIVKTKDMEEKANGRSQKILGTKEAVLIQFLNPKAYIFNTTIVVGFLVPMNLGIFQYILFLGMCCVIFFCCCSTWALFGHGFKKLFARYGKALNLVLGGSLVYLAISIAFHL